MKLTRFLISRWLDLEELFRINLKREQMMYCHISAYMHSLIYLQKHDPLLKKKSIIWKKFYNAKTQDIKNKYFDKLASYRPAENSIIVEALSKIEFKSINERLAGVGSIWRPFTIGILTYEYENA